MSRSKKSRKPGGAPTAKPKLSKQELEKVEKRIRKTTGKVAGNRQKEAMVKKGESHQKVANQDPRLGNKTPIVLGKKPTQTEKKTTKKSLETHQSSAPIASVRFVDNSVNDTAIAEVSAEQELAAIEQDETLQTILAKQEDDVALTEQEVDYYNEKMERHQTLSAQLGLDEEAIDDEPHTSENGSEDDLWDKLDRSDLSDFEDKE